MNKTLTLNGVALAILFSTAAAQAASLDETISTSLMTHPDVKQAYDNYVTRSHLVDEAKAGFLPKVDAVAGVGHEKISTDGSASTSLSRQEMGISLSQMLFDGFSTSSNVHRTKAEAEAQRFALIAQANNTALRVAEVYLNVMRYQEILRLSQENLATHKVILDDIEKRTTSGVGSSADYLQIKGRVARAEANLASAENNLLDAETEFARVTNAAPADLVLPVPDESKMPMTLAEAKDLAHKVHPTLKSADKDVEATQFQYEASKSNFYPQVSLEGSQYYYDGADGFDGKTDTGQIMLRVRYNLFNGGGDVAQKRATASQIAEAKDVKVNALRQLDESVGLAWNAREILMKQRDFMQEHVKSSFETVQAYRKQFLLGTRSLLDVLNTENELFEARQNAVNNDYDGVYATYRILNATGHLLDSVSFKAPMEWASTETE